MSGFDPYAPPSSTVADVADESVALEAELGEPHPPVRVSARAGVQWVEDGWRLFRRQPWTWVLVTLLLGIVPIAASFVPYLGLLLGALFIPVAGGLVIGIRRLARGGRLRVVDLIAGFRTGNWRLIYAGLIYCVAGLALGIGVYAAFYDLSFYFLMLSGDEEALVQAVAQSPTRYYLALLVLMLLSLPLMGAFWFVGPLCALQADVPVSRAIRWSLIGVVKNILPFLLFFLIFMLLWIAGTLLLGLGLLVVAPMFLCAAYASYRDVFLR